MPVTTRGTPSTPGATSLPLNAKQNLISEINTGISNWEKSPQKTYLQSVCHGFFGADLTLFSSKKWEMWHLIVVKCHSPPSLQRGVRGDDSKSQENILKRKQPKWQCPGPQWQLSSRKCEGTCQAEKSAGFQSRHWTKQFVLPSKLHLRGWNRGNPFPTYRRYRHSKTWQLNAKRTLWACWLTDKRKADKM